jgi:hypothetical protein
MDGNKDYCCSVMNPKIILFFTLLPFVLHAADTTPPIYGAAFDKAISAAIIEIQTIQPGQTRKDLLKLFDYEGGLQSREENHFVYRKCPYIKVDVKFKVVGPAVMMEFKGSPDDVITSTSKPYLEFGIID